MNRVQKVAASYLVALAVFGWGFAAGAYEVFPWTSMRRVVHGLRALNAATDTTSRRPGPDTLAVARYGPGGLEDMDVVAIDGLRGRREAPRLRLAAAAPSGLRLIWGAFDFEDALWGGVLLGPRGEVLHTWRLPMEHERTGDDPVFRRGLTGVRVLPDGSVIYIAEETEGGIIRVGPCGERLWKTQGLFHHALSPTTEGSFWTLEGPRSVFDQTLALVDMGSGQVRRRIGLEEIAGANPGVHIFRLQRRDEPYPVDGNDVEPLPDRLAGSFAAFDGGDLLVSLRTTNLLFVVDPETLEVKWWRVGPWDRQHDADWDAGRITVLSNNERGVGEHSNIVAIDPGSLRDTVLVDGSRYGFRSAADGTHQVTSAGSVLVASGMQGRAFEVDLRTGDVVFDFVNVLSRASGTSLRVAGARFLEPDYFDPGALGSCPS